MIPVNIAVIHDVWSAQGNRLCHGKTSEMIPQLLNASQWDFLCLLSLISLLMSTPCLFLVSGQHLFFEHFHSIIDHPCTISLLFVSLLDIVDHWNHPAIRRLIIHRSIPQAWVTISHPEHTYRLFCNHSSIIISWYQWWLFNSTDHRLKIYQNIDINHEQRIWPFVQTTYYRRFWSVLFGCNLWSTLFHSVRVRNSFPPIILSWLIINNRSHLFNRCWKE